jgi:2-haloacid dehalogenase
VTVEAVFFDLFGTLLPLGQLDDACDALAPGRGNEIAVRWRARQIEATWLRTIMDRWTDFDVVTVDALGATLEELGLDVDHAAVAETASAFARLPLDPPATPAIDRLRGAGVSVGVLTNASRATLDAVLGRVGMPFDHALSVDAVRRFKPDPAVYRLAVDAVGVRADRIGFVTANGWDAAGASAFGFRVAWLRPGSHAAMPSVGASPPSIVGWPEIPDVFVKGNAKRA